MGSGYLLEHTVAIVEHGRLVELLLDPGDDFVGDEGRHGHTPQPLVPIRRLLRLRRDVVEAQAQRGGGGQLALDLVELVHESGEVHCARAVGLVDFIDFKSTTITITVGGWHSQIKRNEIALGGRE